MDRLAIEGGKPTRKNFLPFHQPFLTEEEEREIIDTLRSGWITTGPKTHKFEEEFKEYVRAKYAVGVNSCTAALHLALVAIGINSEDSVITTPITFGSTVNVIVHQRASPIFIDVEPDTLNISPDKLEEYLKKRPMIKSLKAIIPVHLAGHPCEMDKIMEIAEQYNLVVIEDAAHAIEAEYKGKKIGSISEMTAFSFYATKNITTGEGGMLTTDDPDLAEKIRILSLHGISRDAWKRYGEEGYKHWDILYPGYKYNMSDIQAALGLKQLKKIEMFWKKRKRYADIYDAAFKDIPEVIPLSRRREIKHAHHLYIIIVKTEELTADRDTIMNAIQAENIGIGIHFRAIHLHPYYQKTYHFKRGEFPEAEYASDRVISLPLYPKMTEEDVQDVIVAVNKVIRHYRR